MRITYLPFIVLLFTLSSCGAVIKSHIRKDPENVPPDFGKQKTTLLALEQKKGYNNKVEKILKKNYSGEYVFVSQEALNIQPYQGTIKYRYLLNDNLSMSQAFTGSSNQMVSTASRSFRIIYCKSKKVHDTGVSSGASWKAVLKAYLKKLDDARKRMVEFDI